MDLFEGCDWTGIRIHRVIPVLAKASEQLVTDYVNPREYQLGVKFHGRTEINFADKQLLSGTDYPISHIAMLCGFADPNYFIRFFHRHEDITPGNYRIRYLKRENG